MGSVAQPIGLGKGTGTQTDRYWNRSWYVWNGTVIDQCSYQDTSQGYTYC